MSSAGRAAIAGTDAGTSKPTVHPIKLLAKSYGLLLGGGPTGLDTLLTTPSGRLTTST